MWRVRNVDHLVYARSCWPETRLFGRVGRGCTFLLLMLRIPLRVPSLAPICGDLHDRTRFDVSLPVTKLRSNFHFQMGSHSSSWPEQGRIGMPKVHDICAYAHFVLPMPSTTSAIVSPIALIFRAFGYVCGNKIGSQVDANMRLFTKSFFR